MKPCSFRGCSPSCEAFALDGPGVRAPDGALEPLCARHMSLVLGRSRFRVVTRHGEGASLFYVVDTFQPEDEQPCVVHTFSTRKSGNARFLADDFCARHNAKEGVPS